MASSCNNLITIQCSSHSYAFARCRVQGDGEITEMRMVRKYSRSKCTYDWSYGHQGGQVWVNHGCRAQFAVCYDLVSYHLLFVLSYLLCHVLMSLYSSELRF